MKFATEIIADTIVEKLGPSPQFSQETANGLARDIETALGAEGYAIAAGVAPPTGGGTGIEVKPPKLKSTSRTQGDAK